MVGNNSFRRVVCFFFFLAEDFISISFCFPPRFLLANMIPSVCVVFEWLDFRVIVLPFLFWMVRLVFQQPNPILVTFPRRSFCLLPCASVP